MRWFAILAAAFWFWSAPTLVAQDEKKQEKAEQQEPAQESEFDKLKVELDQAMKEMREAQKGLIAEFRAAKDEEAKAEIIKKVQALAEPVEEKRTELGKKAVELLGQEISADESFSIIEWIFTNTRDDESRKAALAKLESDHLSNEKILDLLPNLSRGMDAVSQLVLETIAQKGGSDEIKGAGLLILSQYLSRAKTTAQEMLGESPEDLKNLPEGFVEYFKKVKDIPDEEIEGMLIKARDDFAEVKFRGSTIGKLAAKQLKVIEVQKNLAVGKTAPEIEGPDIDGVAFKLSDYRGKVVMLDFWGHW
jgi:hypothetical protein